MTTFLLRLISVFRPLYENAGVDFNQLKIIVALKLTMDTRRQTAASMRGWNKKDEANNRFIASLIFLSIMSGLMSLFISMAATPYIGFTLFFAFVMMMCVMTLITDYSSVLLDTADSVILLPRPVNSQTLFWSRMTHISLFIGQIVFALMIVPLCVVIFKFGGIVAAIFFVLMILSALFAVFLTTILYLLAIRYVSEEKLKDVINYLQIGMAIFFYAGYQILPRMIDFKGIGESTIAPSGWHMLIPPMWMSGTMDSVITGNFEGVRLALIALSFIAPLGGIWLMSHYFSSGFSNKLTAMSTDYTAKIAAVIPFSRDSYGTVTDAKRAFMHRLSKWVTTNSVERGSFQLIWLQLSRDRKLKLRLYPQLAYGLVLFVIFLIPSTKRGESFSLSEVLQTLSTSRMYVMLIYISALTLLTMANTIIYSDDFKAAWIYYALPIRRPGEILAGSFKAQLFKFFIPFFMINATIIFFIWGFKVIDDIIFGLLNIMIIALISLVLDKPKLPFSEMATGNSQGGNSAYMFFTMFVFMAIAVIHFLLIHTRYLVVICIPFQIIGLYFLMKSYKNTTWKNVNFAD